MKNDKGFTLIEVLVVALLAGIVGLGTINAIAQSNKILNETTQHTMVNANTRLVLNDIGRDVKQGVALSTPNETGHWFLTIYNADATTVQWRYLYVNDQYIPIRINSNGVTRRYKPIGLREHGKYKYFLPFFHVNRNTHDISMPSVGKYHKVDIRMHHYDPSGGYISSLERTTFYCKHVAYYYGF